MIKQGGYMEEGIISMINPQRGMIGVTLINKTYSAIEILDNIDLKSVVGK